MGNLVNLKEYKEKKYKEEQDGYNISMVVCLSCCRRWVTNRPMQTKLVQLECPGCSKQGFTIETGEHLDCNCDCDHQLD